MPHRFGASPTDETARPSCCPKRLRGVQFDPAVFPAPSARKALPVRAILPTEAHIEPPLENETARLGRCSWTRCHRARGTPPHLPASCSADYEALQALRVFVLAAIVPMLPVCPHRKRVLPPMCREFAVLPRSVASTTLPAPRHAASRGTETKRHGDESARCDRTWQADTRRTFGKPRPDPSSLVRRAGPCHPSSKSRRIPRARPRAGSPGRAYAKQVRGASSGAPFREQAEAEHAGASFCFALQWRGPLRLLPSPLARATGCGRKSPLRPLCSENQSSGN